MVIQQIKYLQEILIIHPTLQKFLMLEFHILVILSHHGGNLTGPTCQLLEEYLYILRGVTEDHLMEFLPLGGLMV